MEKSLQENTCQTAHGVVINYLFNETFKSYLFNETFKSHI